MSNGERKSILARCNIHPKSSLVKEMARCVFCMGGACKRCGEHAYKNQDHPAIDKLHSTWITDSILAMQRPSNYLFEKHGVLNQFIQNNVLAVFNLTEPGEHPYCGCSGLQSSGFPYSPEILMASGIKHFNYSWEDMTTPSLNMMKDITSVACNEVLNGGKVAVHCHAGYGRTGIVIACMLVRLQGLSAQDAIKLVRTQRPGSVQTAKQQSFVRLFESEYHTTVTIFPSPTQPQPCLSKSIAASVRDQNVALPVSEVSKIPKLRWVPKVVHHALLMTQHYIRAHSVAIIGCLVGVCFLKDPSGETSWRNLTIDKVACDSLKTELNKNEWRTFDGYFSSLLSCCADAQAGVGLAARGADACSGTASMLPSTEQLSSMHLLVCIMFDFLSTRSDAVFSDMHTAAMSELWLAWRWPRAEDDPPTAAAAAAAWLEQGQSAVRLVESGQLDRYQLRTLALVIECMATASQQPGRLGDRAMALLLLRMSITLCTHNQNSGRIASVFLQDDCLRLYVDLLQGLSADLCSPAAAQDGYGPLSLLHAAYSLTVQRLTLAAPASVAALVDVANRVFGCALSLLLLLQQGWMPAKGLRRLTAAAV